MKKIEYMVGFRNNVSIKRHAQILMEGLLRRDSFEFYALFIYCQEAKWVSG